MKSYLYTSYMIMYVFDISYICKLLTQNLFSQFFTMSLHICSSLIVLLNEYLYISIVWLSSMPPLYTEPLLILIINALRAMIKKIYPVNLGANVIGYYFGVGGAKKGTAVVGSYAFDIHTLLLFLLLLLLLLFLLLLLLLLYYTHSI